MTTYDDFIPANQFLDPLNCADGKCVYSKKIIDGSIFDPDFISTERQKSSIFKTIVLDLDETMRGWDDAHHTTFLRHHLRGLLEKLKEKKYRLVIWSASNKDSIQQTLNMYPDFEQFFDLIIAAENFSFKFLTPDQQNELKKVDKFYWQDLLKTISDEIDQASGRALFRVPKNIKLFNYSLIIDDDPTIVDEAKKYGFEAFRIFPYKYDNPGYKGLVPQELIDDIDNDLQSNMLERVINAVEDRPSQKEQVYLVED